MAPSDLLCLYCASPAFAVVDVEIGRGRGRWPTCHRLDCTGRALQDAGVRLANAANQHVIENHREMVHPDTTASDQPPIKISGYLDASQQFIESVTVIPRQVGKVPPPS